MVKYTAQAFVNDLKDIAKYWLSQELTEEQKVYGAIFSALVLIDGDSSANDFHHIDMGFNRSVALHELFCKD